ncbi:MAG: VOC family protein [Boseongicola sp.]
MTYSLALDHLVVVARALEEGTTYVEAILGVEMSAGGKHPNMGTHNRLLSLGPDAYLEVIAIDPAAPKPPHRRWFGLDAYVGAPRMMNWVCQTDDIEAALEDAPPGSGNPMRQSRGEFEWHMAIPEFGRLPFDDACPALIRWGDGPHPAARLPDYGIRLSRLDVFHPRAPELLAEFPALHRINQASVRQGPEKRLIATVSTPEGNRVLA